MSQPAEFARGGPMNSNSRPCRKSARAAATCDRRSFLEAAGAAGLAFIGHSSAAAEPAAARPPLKELGIPGPFPGRVVEVRDPASVRQGVPDPEAVRRM